MSSKQPSIVTKFREAIMLLSRDVPPPTIAIVLHDNPDPDCIGAACGLGKLLRAWVPDIKCVMLYSGEIAHPQNRTMVNVLNLQFVNRIDHPVLSSDFAQAYVVVDTIPERCNLGNIECLLTIDHHKGDTKKSKLKDIRMVGSASSIVWDYLREAEVSFDKNKDEDCDVATAMVVGIKTDTFDLASENVTALEFDAYKSLISYVNLRKLGIIVNYPLPPYHFELRSRLDQSGNARLDNGVFLGGIGYIETSKRDALPTIASERSRVEGTDTAFIFAIVGDKIEASVRSNGSSIDVHSLCQTVFGKEYAGGKQGAGAAKIPLPFSLEDSSEKVIETLWVSIRDYWFERVEKAFQKIR